MIRVLLADDHALVRAGIRSLLGAMAEVTVVADDLERFSARYLKLWGQGAVRRGKGGLHVDTPTASLSVVPPDSAPGLIMAINWRAPSKARRSNRPDRTQGLPGD